MKTQSEAIELIIKSIPYPQHISDIDLKHPEAVYFTWRSARYKLDVEFCRVNKVEGQLLLGDDASLLMTELFQRTQVKIQK